VNLRLVAGQAHIRQRLAQVHHGHFLPSQLTQASGYPGGEPGVLSEQLGRLLPNNQDAVSGLGVRLEALLQLQRRFPGNNLSRFRARSLRFAGRRTSGEQLVEFSSFGTVEIILKIGYSDEGQYGGQLVVSSPA
jgi:hypothetical protein